MEENQPLVTSVPDYNKKLNDITNKPVYLIIVEDPTVTDGISYYKVIDSKNIVNGEHTIELRKCYQLNKSEANNVRKGAEKQKAEKNKKEKQELQLEIPWSRVIRIENITYKNKEKK